MQDFQANLSAFSRSSSSKDFRQALSEALEPGIARDLYDESMAANDEYNEVTGFDPLASAMKASKARSRMEDKGQGTGSKPATKKQVTAKGTAKRRARLQSRAEDSDDEGVDSEAMDRPKVDVSRDAPRKRKLSEISRIPKGIGKESDDSGSPSSASTHTSGSSRPRDSPVDRNGRTSGDASNGSGDKRSSKLKLNSGV